VFPLEPIVQVRAPIIEAQIVETYLLTMINMQSLIATKAARMVSAAEGRGVVDFGSRRAHGPQAALLAARASYLAGCLGTSNVLAGFLSSIPIYGTAAHSFSMAFATELEAFRAYYKVFPENTVLLIDTYDILQAAAKVKEIGPQVLAVRVDSGDLEEMSFKVREILNRDGLHSVKIFASGDLNEWKIEKLVKAGAPIDFFGVGTELVTSYDDPALSGVYKLVEATLEGKAAMRLKTSPGKKSYPGIKQIYRFTSGSLYARDLLSLAEEPCPEGAAPLLQCYMRDGKVIDELPSLDEIRHSTASELKRLAPPLHQLESAQAYPVELSQKLFDKMKAIEAGAKAS